MKYDVEEHIGPKFQKILPNAANAANAIYSLSWHYLVFRMIQSFMNNLIHKFRPYQWKLMSA